MTNWPPKPQETPVQEAPQAAKAPKVAPLKKKEDWPPKPKAAPVKKKSDWPPGESFQAEEAAKPAAGMTAGEWSTNQYLTKWNLSKAAAAHGVAFVAAVVLSVAMDVPMVALIVCAQFIALTSGIYMFPTKELLGMLGFADGPVVLGSLHSGATFGKKAGKKAGKKDNKEVVTKRYGNWYSNPKPTTDGRPAEEHCTEILGYPEELLEGLPALNGCGAGCPFLAAEPGELKGKKVIDLGSGPGMDSLIANKLGAKQVLGMDITEAGVKSAQAHARETGVFQDVEFIVQAIDEEMPKKLLGTADVVMSNGVINLCEKKAKVFMNAYALLKAEGTFLFSDCLLIKPMPPPKWGEEEESALAGWVLGCVSKEDNIKLMQAAGFDVKFVGWSELYTSEYTRGANFRCTKKSGARKW